MDYSSKWSELFKGVQGKLPQKNEGEKANSEKKENETLFKGQPSSSGEVTADDLYGGMVSFNKSSGTAGAKNLHSSTFGEFLHSLTNPTELTAPTQSAEPPVPSASVSTPSASVSTPSASASTPSASVSTPSASVSTPSASVTTPTTTPVTEGDKGSLTYIKAVLSIAGSEHVEDTFADIKYDEKGRVIEFSERYKNVLTYMGAQTGNDYKIKYNEDGSFEITITAVTTAPAYEKRPVTVKKFDAEGKEIKDELKPTQLEFFAELLGIKDMTAENYDIAVLKDTTSRICDIRSKNGSTSYKIEYGDNGEISVTDRSSSNPPMPGFVPVTTTYNSEGKKIREEFSNGFTLGPSAGYTMVTEFDGNGNVTKTTKTWDNAIYHDGVASEVTTKDSSGKEVVVKLDADGKDITNRPVVEEGKPGSAQYLANTILKGSYLANNIYLFTAKYDDQGRIVELAPNPNADGPKDVEVKNYTITYNADNTVTIKSVDSKKAEEVKTFDAEGKEVVQAPDVYKPVKEGDPGSLTWFKNIKAVSNLNCYTVEYDSQGRVSKFKWDGGYTDEKTGKRLEVNTVQPDYSVSYNDDGSVTLTPSKDFGGLYLPKTFDKDGNDITAKKAGKPGSLEFTASLLGMKADEIANAKYDAYGRIISFTDNKEYIGGEAPQYTVEYWGDNIQINKVQGGVETNKSESSKVFNTDGKLKSSSEVLYTNDGNISSISNYYLSGDVATSSYTKYMYDEKGRVTSSETTWYVNGEIDAVNKTEIKYDGNGRETSYSIKETDAKGNIRYSYQTENQYYDNGNLKYTYYNQQNEDGSIYKGKSNYYEDGTVKDRLSTEYDKDGLRVSDIEWTYDEKGALIKETGKQIIKAGSTRFVNGLRLENKGKENAEVTFTLNADGQFELNASGLDISAEQIRILFNGNNYPVYDKTAKGDIEISSDGENTQVNVADGVDAEINIDEKGNVNVIDKSSSVMLYPRYWGAMENITIIGNNNNITGTDKDDNITVKGDNNKIDLGAGEDTLVIQGDNITAENVENIYTTDYVKGSVNYLSLLNSEWKINPDNYDITKDDQGRVTKLTLKETVKTTANSMEFTISYDDANGEVTVTPKQVMLADAPKHSYTYNDKYALVREKISGGLTQNPYETTIEYKDNGRKIETTEYKKALGNGVAKKVTEYDANGYFTGKSYDKDGKKLEEKYGCEYSDGSGYENIQTFDAGSNDRKTETMTGRDAKGNVTFSYTNETNVKMPCVSTYDAKSLTIIFTGDKELKLSDGDKIVVNADGTSSLTKKDGTVLTYDKNGNVKNTAIAVPVIDGSSITFAGGETLALKNGETAVMNKSDYSIVVTSKDKKTVTKYDKTGNKLCTIKDADLSKVPSMQNGNQVKFDGGITVTFKNGETVSILSNQNVVVTSKDSKAVKCYDKTGKIFSTIVDNNGSALPKITSGNVVEFDGGKKVTVKDQSSATINKDGTVTLKKTDGTTITYDKKGNVTASSIEVPTITDTKVTFANGKSIDLKDGETAVMNNDDYSVVVTSKDKKTVTKYNKSGSVLCTMSDADLSKVPSMQNGNQVKFDGGSTLTFKSGETVVIDSKQQVTVTSKDGKTVRCYNKSGKLLSEVTDNNGTGTPNASGNTIKFTAKSDKEAAVTLSLPTGSKAVIDKNGNVTVTQTDGTIKQYDKYGKLQSTEIAVPVIESSKITFANGKTLALKDGETAVMNKSDYSIVVTSKDKKTITKYDKTGNVLCKMSDAVLGDGVMMQNGNQVKFVGGSTMTFKSGETVSILSNQNVVVTSKDGKTVKCYDKSGKIFSTIVDNNGKDLPKITGGNTIEFDGGKKISVKDKSSATINSDGTVKLIKTDGTVISYDKNGNVTSSLKEVPTIDGSKVTFVGGKSITLADGETAAVNNTDNSVTVTSKDKKKVTKYNSKGTMMYAVVDGNGNTLPSVVSDKLKISDKTSVNIPTGAYITISGSDNSAAILSADGKTRDCYKNGALLNKTINNNTSSLPAMWKNGFVKFDEEGKKSICPTNGETVTINADGTVNVVSKDGKTATVYDKAGNVSCNVTDNNSTGKPNLSGSQIVFEAKSGAKAVAINLPAKGKVEINKDGTVKVTEANGTFIVYDKYGTKTSSSYEGTKPITASRLFAILGGTTLYGAKTLLSKADKGSEASGGSTGKDNGFLISLADLQKAYKKYSEKTTEGQIVRMFYDGKGFTKLGANLAKIGAAWGGQSNSFIDFGEIVDGLGFNRQDVSSSTITFDDLFKKYQSAK